jgi:hypothetical protein
MTIYIIELTSYNLGRLPSTRIVFNLCSVICEGILKHYSTALLALNRPAQQLIANQIITLQWYLGVLGRATSDYSDVDYPVEVSYIYLDRMVSIATPSVKQAITMHTLNDVCPKLLLEFMHKLLDDSFTCITPHLTLMPSEQLRECRNTIMRITSDLSRFVGTLPSAGRPGLGRLLVSNFTSVILRIKVKDEKKDEIKNLV